MGGEWDEGLPKKNYDHDVEYADKEVDDVNKYVNEYDDDNADGDANDANNHVNECVVC